MLASSSLFADALLRPHRPLIRVEVWRSGVKLFDELAFRPDGSSVWFTDGSVRATLSSRVVRSAQITVSGRFYPQQPTDVFWPYGNELRIFRGIDFGAGLSEEFPVFCGPIVSVAESDDGSLRVEAADRAYRVIADQFTSCGGR